ncbi:malto-oligosyltrehalose trehalohydrolase [Pseudomonas matsuisoli]|uniref:Malto-oligosyltrehalose trehalohydrolase n=1 Tax=Pseudomonas matsuisoli TaxID=1515666 RepID=A0A917UUG6_9PSED|nr:malto-oligosyltrehalose trehalohydrolase [Pseudomonas matsuisoli]GGJ86265.1 malto-oligosyltrehalose trehalohydrolase [Pseudomonas matsuisoli]
MVSTKELSSRFGAVPLDTKTTRFSLWAPSASHVEVHLEDGRGFTLDALEEGWYSADVECPVGTAYQFVADGNAPVPDPASRFQRDDVHGVSIVTDLAAYPWTQAGWKGRPWHETVLYELHVGLLGGYAGVEAQLPRLVELGVTAIELMPLNQFTGDRNWGYDGVLPFAPAYAYGTPDQLQHLIDRAHELGLMVFLDVVYNHFGPDGNYLGQYASDFFREDIPTPWGQAIDFRKPQVCEFFIENALMWLRDYRFDGLRLDAVHAISEKRFLTDLSDRVRRELPDRQIHLVLENEHNNACLLETHFEAQWNDDGHNVLHHLLTGEREAYYADYCDEPTKKLAAVLGEGFIYQGQKNRHGKTRGEPSAHLSPLSFVLFLQNHDQTGNRALGDRLVTLAEPEALRAATALLLLSPMVPLLFMGEEWGSRQPFLFFTDFHDELADAVREGRRNEFAEFESFNDPEARERIPDPNAVETFERSRPDFAAIESGEHAEWYALYRTLLALRAQAIVPHLPQSRALGAQIYGEGAVMARWAMGAERVLRVDLNLSAAAVQIAPVAGELLFATRTSVSEAARSGTLEAHSALFTWEAAHE